MRKLGDVLIWLGAAVGVATTAAVLFHANLPMVPWLVAVGLVKLSYAGSVGLLAAGGYVRRLGARAEQRLALTVESHESRPRLNGD